jgi:hypothetical protein
MRNEQKAKKTERSLFHLFEKRNFCLPHKYIIKVIFYTREK